MRAVFDPWALVGLAHDIEFINYAPTIYIYDAYAQSKKKK